MRRHSKLSHMLGIHDVVFCGDMAASIKFQAQLIPG